MHYLLFIFVCSMWGTNFLLMDKARGAFGPISIGAGRVFGGAIVLAIVWLAMRKKWPVKSRDFLPLLFIATVGMAWPFALQPHLIGMYGSGFMGMMVALVPLLTVLVSVPILGEYPTMRQLFGVIGGLVCLALIMKDGMVTRDVTPLGICLVVTIPLNYAVCNTYIKRRFADVSPVVLTLNTLALAAIVLMPLAVTLETVKVDEKFLLAAAAALTLTVLGTGVGALAFYKLLQDKGPLFAGMVTYIVPAIAISLGWLVNAEKVTVLQLSALAGVLLMVAVVQYQPAAAKPAETVTPP